MSLTSLEVVIKDNKTLSGYELETQALIRSPLYQVSSDCTTCARPQLQGTQLLELWFQSKVKDMHVVWAFIFVILFEAYQEVIPWGPQHCSCTSRFAHWVDLQDPLVVVLCIPDNCLSLVATCQHC